MSYFGPEMAVPRELQTDYGMMVTANLLMAASIESLRRKDEQLEAENAKLRTQLADVTESVGRIEERCAKLRELCADMHECLEDECKRCHEWGDMCDLEYEMRKLGVMV